MLCLTMFTWRGKGEGLTDMRYTALRIMNSWNPLLRGAYSCRVFE